MAEFFISELESFLGACMYITTLAVVLYYFLEPIYEEVDDEDKTGE